MNTMQREMEASEMMGDVATHSDWWLDPRSERIQDCSFLDPSFIGKSMQVGIKTRLTDSGGLRIMPTPEIVVAVTDGNTTIEYGVTPDYFSLFSKFVEAFKKEMT